MNNSGQLLLYIFLLLISLASGYWFYNNFTWVNEEQEVGFQGIAKTNKLLASEFFLRKMGVQVQQVNGLVAFRDLPSEKHTLLIATQRETLNKELSQKLLAWVRSGGHLIIEARPIEKEKTKLKENKDSELKMDDDLLEEFFIFTEAGDPCGCDTEKNSSDESDSMEINEVEVDIEETEEEDEDELVPVLVTLDEKIEIEVNFPYYKSLQNSLPKKASEVALSWLVNDDAGQYLMQFPLENGLLTVLTSTVMFNNDQIAKYDHARFLHYLVQQQGHDAGVWLIRVDDMPPLWQWLWTNAWYLMFSLALLFFFWLWRVPLRFGPLMNDEQMARRSLMEHIQASGYYRWHKKQSGYLLSKVQNTLWDKIQTIHPGVNRENPVQAYNKLEQITGIKQSLIKQSLMSVDHITEQEFLKRIKMLEVIRKSL